MNFICNSLQVLKPSVTIVAKIKTKLQQRCKKKPEPCIIGFNGIYVYRRLLFLISLQLGCQPKKLSVYLSVSWPLYLRFYYRIHRTDTLRSVTDVY